MCRWVSVLTSIVVTVWLAVPVAAAPASSPEAGSSPPTAAHGKPSLADLDADGISDELAARLHRAGPRAAFDVIVLHDGSVPPASAARAVGEVRAQRSFTIIDGFAARLTVGQIRALARVPGVERAQTDALAHVTDSSSDADYGAAGARTGFAVDGSGTRICVLDTGVDPGHEQLAGKIEAFKDFTSSATTAYDDHGHGTHVASIAAGDGTGGPDAAANVGVAPGAALVVGGASPRAGRVPPNRSSTASSGAPVSRASTSSR